MNIRYRQYICEKIQNASQNIADDWLKRLEPVVQEDLRDIFPTEQYLDHIPSMIEEIGRILTLPDENISLANSVISRKALQLGTLRHQQKATVSQLLREYDILAFMLEDFIRESSALFEGKTSIDDSISIIGTVNKIVRYILQCTIDSFIEKYMSTIQEQTEKLLSFNKFIGHELRTPLQSALLNTELLIETRGVTDSDTVELLKIKNAIQTASSLISNIEQLIQSSDPVVGDSPVIQSVELEGMVADIREQLSDTLEQRDIKLKCCGQLGSLNIETGKLRLMLMNLITNSIKYSDVNKDQRLIEVKREDKPDLSINLSIKDNGLGIPKDMISDVQGLRVRAHRDLDDDNGVSGEGLGLFLVSEAARNLGGSIAVASEEGQYTQVTITIPKPVID